MKIPSVDFDRAARRGLTLVEITVSLAVLTVSVYLLSSTITSVLVHAESKQERTLAVDAAMNQLELMRSLPFEELFSLYNADAADDPGGPGTAPGPHFEVRGLAPRDSDPDGFVGQVVLPSETSYLRENAALTALSMPRDLNGDVMIDGEDHAGDYILLPVLVRIEWDGRVGRRSFEMSTLLAKMEKYRP